MKVRIGLMFGSLLAGALFLGAVTMGQQPQAPPQVPAPRSRAYPPSPANAPNAPDVPSPAATQNPANPPTAPTAPSAPSPTSVPNAPAAPNQPNAPQPPDPLADVMFPPDMILGHARQLGLTDEQKAFVRGEVQKTMTSFNELQWKLQDEMEVLHETLKSSSVNEQQALAQLNKVLDIEREIKRLHIGLGVRIKNHLTAEQQEQLQRMRMAHMRMVAPNSTLPPNQ